MQRFKAIRFYLLFAILTAGFCLNAQAQDNALVNPGFTMDFSGWSQFFNREAEWSSEDADGSGSSGSALVTNEGTSDGIVPLVLFQCIQVAGGQEVQWGGDTKLPAGQPSGTVPYIFAEPFLNSNCNGTAITFASARGGSGGNWVSTSSSMVTPLNTMSIRIGIGVFKPNGETADAEGLFDNVFLYLPNAEGIVVNPSMSASWFNPDESGHGIMIHLLDSDTAWMCWFTFTLTGEPVWICAIGQIMGDTIVFEDAFTVEGGAFPPNFDPEQIVEIPWGTITVVFTGCDSGVMTWTTSVPGFTSGSMPLVRLTTLWGVSCP
jgi:hypothetical protein